jgi:hypothetical protein
LIIRVRILLEITMSIDINIESVIILELGTIPFDLDS